MTQALPMSPLDYYQDAIRFRGFRVDPLQAAAVQLTQRLYQQLVEPDGGNGLFSGIRRRYSRKKSTIKGLYLWGGVGRGKTWLLDSFYASLPIANKRRMHFHEFMLEIHAHLSALPKTPDPLPIIAARMGFRFSTGTYLVLALPSALAGGLPGCLLIAVVVACASLVPDALLSPNEQNVLRKILSDRLRK